MDKNIIIEPLTEFSQDLVQNIKNLEFQNFGEEAAANEWLIPVFIRYGRVIVAKRFGELVGVCLAVRSWQDQKAFIHSFHLKTGYRNKGIGGLMLKKIMLLMKKEKIKLVELTVDPKNEDALRLYARHGFKIKLLRRDEYGLGVDRYLLELRL